MPNMTLAVSKELRQEMDTFPIINWSEVARQAIRQKLDELKMLQKITSKSKLREKDVLEIGRKINASITQRHEQWEKERRR